MKWRKIHSEEEMEAFFLEVLPAIRSAARELGFGIGLHGSMRRDLDLIAVPWSEDHASPEELAMTVQKAACGMHGSVVSWEKKPCGRIATSLPICWTEDNRPSAGHIDLSVMMPNDKHRRQRPGKGTTCRKN